MAPNITRYFSLTRFLLRSFWRYVWSFVLMMALGLVSGGFESLGIASVIPLFYLVTGQSQLQGTERISKIIQWFFGTIHTALTPTSLIIFIGGLFILKAVVQVATRYLNALTVANFEEGIRRILFRRTLGTSWTFLSQQKLGHLEGILLYDVERGSTLMASIASVITTGTTFLMYAVVAMTISVRITAITLGLGATLFLLFKPLFSKIRKLITKSSLVQKELNHHVAEHMLSAKSIKALAVEQPVIDEAYTMFHSLRTAKIHTALFRQSTMAVLEPVGFILIGSLFVYSYQKPGFAIASFAIIMYLVNQMFNYLQSLQSQIHLANELIPYLRSAMRYRRQVALHKEVSEGTRPFSFKQELTFQGVTFSYVEARPVLHDITFSIHAGEHVAIVGPSGTGKTTIVDLLLRLLEPATGQITTDAKPVKEIRLKSWRRHIGYVPQDGLLLNTSVLENIRFYDPRITEKDIIAAAKAANIYDTVMALPEQFNTTTGERGVELSGGQRQRIILARALARRPAILVLDEATSSIDTESEALIQKAIASLRGKITVIAITHRLTSIGDMDRVIVIEDGCVAEEGSPQELMKRKDSYLARLLAHR